MREIIDLNCSYSQLSCSSKTVTLGTGSKRSSKRNVRCFIECYILVHELPGIDRVGSFVFYKRAAKLQEDMGLVQ